MVGKLEFGSSEDVEGWNDGEMLGVMCIDMASVESFFVCVFQVCKHCVFMLFRRCHSSCLTGSLFQGLGNGP